jgi:ATP-binding cassette subfamily F protein 3
MSLFTCPDLCLRRGERAAILGPNGSGKTTFLKTILSEVPPLAGLVQIGANVKFGYLAQAHEGLDKERTVLDEILEVRNLPLEKARGFLGRFLFSGDDVFKLVGDLSGGERSRVALAKLTLEGANFLLLDEPTNHLDIASQEILEEVLADFNGTILLVSHDRYLINALATQVWAIEDGELRVYDGNYSDYEEQRSKGTKEQGSRGAGEQGSRGAGEQRSKGARGRRQEATSERQEAKAKELEEDIATLEARLAALGEDLVTASVAQDVESLRELGLEYQRVDKELQRLFVQWAEAVVV